MAAFEVVQPAGLSFWSLIGRTFSTIKDRPLFFFSLTIMTMLPLELLEWQGNNSASEIISSILGAVLAGAIAYGVFNDLKDDNSISLGLAISHALRWPLIGVALMYALLSILGQVWVDWIDCLGGGLVGAIGELFLLGLHFCLLSFFLVVIQVCVVEKLGVFASLMRSLELTRSHRSRIFFFLVGFCCLFVLPVLLLVWYLSTIFFGGVFLPVTGNYPDTIAQLGVYLVYAIYCILLEAFSATIYAIMYCDLRAIDEGLSV